MPDEVNRAIDFDTFRRETDGKPVVVSIGGETYDLPAELPAQVMLDIIRMRRAMGDDAEADMLALDRLGEAMFATEDQPERWRTVLVRHQITPTELGTLIAECVKAYGETPPPNRAARRARAK